MSSNVVNRIEIPNTPASPSSISVGLDNFDATAVSFHWTNASDEVNHPANLVERNAETESIDLPNPVLRKELTNAERLDAYECLLERFHDGVLRKGSTRVVAGMFGVGIRTIQRIWRRARQSGNHEHTSRRPTNCGRKRIQLDSELVSAIPLRHRTTIRSIAYTLGVSRHCISNNMKRGVIKRHTNSIKPLLTQDNMNSRIRYCLSSLYPTTLHLNPTFDRMENTVHIDEKWFWLTKKSQRYYLAQDEGDPVRAMKNANFIPKVMFLVAVARPRYDCNGVCVFDGKLGVFPLVQHIAAIRSSQNRPRGTLEVKPITNITRDVIREYMINKIIPAIASKWPRDSIGERILIQKDNAKTHVHHYDMVFLSAVQASGLNVTLVCQPPNSPDLNVLDLGFFRAIQSLQSKECAKSIEDLITAVEEAYLKFSVKKSNYIFLTLQSCILEILKCDGSNVYKIPHLKKRSLSRLGLLPPTLQCPLELYANAVVLIGAMKPLFC